MSGEARGVTAHPYPATLPALTALRFFAAVWVVSLHFTEWLPGKPAAHVAIVQSGLLGVDFFFVLSGFILTHAHIRQIHARAVAYRPFLVKRFAKVYPMHLAMLLFYLALVTAIGLAHLHLPNPDRYLPGQFVLNLLLVHAWQVRDAGGWNYPSWSVSAEWFAYILFPLLAPFVVLKLARVPAEWLVAGAVAFLLAVWALSEPVLGYSFFDLHSNFGYVRILPEFVLGIALYRLGTERELTLLRSRWAVPALGLAVVALAVWGALLIAVVLLIATMILAAAEATRVGAVRWLAWRPLTYLGEVSYSIYMVHLPVATILLQGVRLKLGHTPPALVVLAFPVTVGVAILCYHVIEKPAHRFLVQRFAGKRPAPQPASV